MASHQASLHPNRTLTEADKLAGDTARQLHSMVQKVCISAVQARSENNAHTLLMLAQAASGILHLLARIAMRDEDANNPVHSTATLFAALLAYQTAPCEKEVGVVQAEFSPLVIFDTLKDMEKLTGQRPDDRLDEQMCRVSRECAADPAIIAQIERERAATERGSSALN